MRSSRSLALLLILCAASSPVLPGAGDAAPSRSRRSAAAKSSSGPQERRVREAIAARAKLESPRHDVLTSLIAEFRAKEAAEAPVSEENADLIAEALKNRGKPYVWGGASRSGFDCSGFVCYLFYLNRGVKLPHSAAAQAREGTPVRSADLRQGDLLFFRTERAGISHVGLFLGDGRFIHAANSRRDVRVDSLAGYYAQRLKAARRIQAAPLRVTAADLEWLRERLLEPATSPATGN